MLHVKGGKENEYRLLGGKKGITRRAGRISLISVSHTLKGYIIREKQSPFHLSLSFSTCTLTQPPSQSLPLCSSRIFSFSCSIMAYWETFIHPHTHPPLLFHYPPFCPLLSPPPPLHPPPPSCLPCLSLSTSLYLITPRGPPCCDPGHW